MDKHGDLSFWLRWIAVNVVAELAGLGLAFLVGLAVVSVLGQPATILATLAYTALAIALGTLEGVFVGLGQWAVLRRRLPELARSRWVRATALGALIAWMLGSAPSTVMNLMPAGANEGPPPDMEGVVVALMAAGLGLVAGAILSAVQWRELLRLRMQGAKIVRAWLWVPANALAWAVAMPLIFAMAGSIQEGAPPVQTALLVLVVVALAGVVVGAIHGAVLVRAMLARPEPTPAMRVVYQNSKGE